MDWWNDNKILKQSVFTIIFTYLFFFMELFLYRQMVILEVASYWIVIPVVLLLICIIGKKILQFRRNINYLFEIPELVAFIFFFICINNEKNFLWFEKRYDQLSFLEILAILIGALLLRYLSSVDEIEGNEESHNDLFNLFYLNTPKAHEIAMLIDNKIMKTIEKEQISEELLKKDSKFSIGKKDLYALDGGYTFEENSKKRVYENFDVKNTKSIMLRKIYATAQKTKKNGLKDGKLVLLEDVELKQRNIDDTLLILNVLQDSKIKNQGNDDLEINMNKMMEKMLDDFTIDYSFEYKWNNQDEEQYIIQLPYKDTVNFENGYQHNDLQLGKLSIIGIYRGNVDFSKRDSISSKFLELVSDSANKSTDAKDTSDMKLSYCINKNNGFEFNFSHQKLKGQYGLIDVIAIIQEINIDDKEE